MTPGGDGLAVAVNGGDALDAFPTPGASSVRLIVPNAELERFAVTFEIGEDGQTLAACHGPTRYAAGDAPREEAVNEAWRAFEGRYESYNPWTPTIRIVQRAGGLVLCERSGMEVPLAPIDDAIFGLGDPALPERLRFDAVVDGIALRANASGCDYYRSFEG